MSEDTGSEVVQLKQRVAFTMVDNPIIRSMTDYVALGLYLDMLSYPPGWRLNLKELAKTHKQGRESISGAMRDLVARGLVFRVRYQQAGGTWATRTYVCSSPVTLDELNNIRAQYLNRCRIETSPELMVAANPKTPPPASVAATSRSGSNQENDPEEPSYGFPALGEPDPGQPTLGTPEHGTPTIGDTGHQGLDSRPKIPPPAPNPPTSDRGATEEEEQEEENKSGRTRQRQVPTLSPQDIDQDSFATSATHEPSPHPTAGADAESTNVVLAAVSRCWPQLGRRDIAKLAFAVAAAISEIGEAATIEHLTANPGGVRNAASVLRARLNNLPVLPRSKVSVQWCGVCSRPDYRWIEDEEGLPQYPCPRCSPQATRPAPQVQSRSSGARPV